VSCWERGYWETLEEFKASPRAELLERLRGLGINVEVMDRSVHYSGCGDGQECLVLKYFCNETDIRSLVCRIFPYKHFEVSGGGITRDTIGIGLSNCPATQPNGSVPEGFTAEVIGVIKKHYRDLYNRDVDVIHIVRPQEC